MPPRPDNPVDPDDSTSGASNGHAPNGHAPNGAKRRALQRPPALGAMKRQADAQAPTLRAELRALMRLDALTAAQVARRAGLDAAALEAFLAGASLNPRWQARLAHWLDQHDQSPGG